MIIKNEKPFPIEMMWIYDIFPDHPENMSTVAAARKQSQRLIEHAESMGFSRDLCSYCKTNIGAYDTKIKKTLGGISKPDIVVCTNAICDTHWKWFQIMADIKNLTAKGEGTMPGGNEKYRVMWEGILFWYRMRFMYDLAQSGVVIAFEPYTYSFAPEKKKCFTMEETLRDVAKLIMDTPYAYNLERRIENFEKWIDEYKLDGVILHENMSCRPSSAGMVDLAEAIMRDKGIPALILQCDMNDPRAYSEGQIKTRVEGFIELMEANKK